MINSFRKWDSSFILIAPVIWVTWLLVILLSAEATDLDLTRFFDQRWLPDYVDVVIGALFILIAAFAMNRVVQNSVLLGRISNFPMLFLLVLSAFISTGAIGLDGGLILLIQVPLLRYILDLPEGQRSHALAYNSGLIIGGMIFLEPWSILLTIVVLQAMLSTGLLDLRKLILHLFGIATPVYLLNAVLFLADEAFIFPAFSMGFSLDVFETLNVQHLLQLGILLLLALFAFLSILQISSHSTLREKRKWFLVVTYAVVAVASMLLAGFSRGFFLMIVPGSIMLSRLFLNGTNKRGLNIALFLLFSLWVLVIFLGS